MRFLTYGFSQKHEYVMLCKKIHCERMVWWRVKLMQYRFVKMQIIIFIFGFIVLYVKMVLKKLRLRDIIYSWIPC